MSLFLFQVLLYAQTTDVLQASRVIDGYTIAFNTGLMPTGNRSSVLIEKGKPVDTYDYYKINDDNPETAWVEGVKGDGIGEYVYIHVVSNNVGYEDFPDNSLQITVNIINGFAKNLNLFNKNNRVKKAELKIFDCALRVGQNDMIRKNKPILYITKTIDLADNMDPQTFTFVITPKDRYSEGNIVAFFLKLTILDVYHGTKYQDSAISELNAEGKLVPYVEGTDVQLPPDWSPVDDSLLR